MNKPVAWLVDNQAYTIKEAADSLSRILETPAIPLYTHPAKEQDDYCKAYWGNNNKFVDVFLPNSETEVIRFWNNTHPVKELTDEEIVEVWNAFERTDNIPIVDFAKAILKKAQEK